MRARRLAITALAFALGSIGAGGAATSLPSTPAGGQLAWVLRVLNSGASPSPAELERHFSPAFLKLAPPAQLVQALAPLAQVRPLRITAVLEQGTLGLQVRIEARDHSTYRVTIQASRPAPHRIEGLLFEPLGVAPTLSVYVPMRDGVRLAVDVRMPSTWERGERVPAILSSTRYWRTSPDFDPFPAAGYASVIADVRGTGASFGTWRGSPSAQETADLGQLVDWIAAQPWSNGRVGAVGVSYAGTTAEMTAAARPKALKAIAPLFSNALPYAEVARPGGLYNRAHLDRWMAANKLLDSGRLPDGSTITPVAADAKGTQLARALRQHRDNFDVSVLARKAAFVDDSSAALHYGWAQASPWTFRRGVERSGVAIYSIDGWFDGGYMLTPLRRYALTTNKQTVVIGSWSHGGLHDADPFRAGDAPRPTQREQMESVRAFFDAYLKTDGKAAPPARTIRYSTLGLPGFRSTAVWPPRGLTTTRFYLSAGRAVARTQPTAKQGSDRYRVRFDATTGIHNRWWTLVGGGDVSYADRKAQDAKLLTYTSAPLTRDIEMTGTGVVSLRIASTATDGGFFVYLEDVAPNGDVSTITEGELRAVDRKVIADRSPLVGWGPLHSFRRADARPLSPGKITELRIGLFPTSVLFRTGHRLRIAIAGADKDTFSRVPATGTPTITVEHNRVHASYVELPLGGR